jgi:transposase-like protein
MPKSKGRRYSREVKLAAVKRMLAGENVPLLAKEVGTTRKSLYEWRASYLRGGSTGAAWKGSAVGIGRGRAATTSERGSAAFAENQ